MLASDSEIDEEQENESGVYDRKQNEEEESSREEEYIEEDEVNVYSDDHLNSRSDNLNEAKFYSEVLASDSEIDDYNEQENENGVYDRKQNEEEESAREEDYIEEDKLNVYSDDQLRNLVHNTTPDGVRFFFTSLKRGTTITQFSHLTSCKVTLGTLPVSMLKDIYAFRKHLLSLYRMAQYYPYPDKNMIDSCLACGASEKGQCSCPVLPKSFYVFARQKCPSHWNCKKCINFDCRGSHACFDFFHCSRCHEEYVASTKYMPYPP